MTRSEMVGATILATTIVAMAAILAFAPCVCAEEKPEPPKIEDVEKERDEAKAALERMTRMAASFQQQAFECVNARAQEAAK